MPADSAAVVNAALQADLPVVIDPNATSGSEFGTVTDPNAQPTQPEAPATGDPAATPPPDATPGQVLPGDVTGQTAAEVRCSSANEG